MSKNFGFVILSYNHPEITSRAVQSLLDMKISGEQILLCHNGSEARWVQKLKKEFSSILHLEIPVNGGFSGGANRALARAFQNWEWVHFLTNDTQLLKYSSSLDLAPGLYAPPIWHRKKQTLDSWGGFLDLRAARLSHSQSADEKPGRRLFYVVGTAFLMHREFFLRHQGFDESLHTFWEDVDLSIQAIKKKDIVGRTHSFEVLHLGGKTCHKDSFYTLFLFQRNRWVITFRHTQGLNLIPLVFYFIYENLRLSIKLLLKNRPRDLFNYHLGLLRFLFRI